MPTGPKGQKRPTDVVSNAVHVMEIATGTSSETTVREKGVNAAAAALGRLGGKARAENLSKRKLQEIARAAAEARWSSSKERRKRRSK